MVADQPALLVDGLVKRFGDRTALAGITFSAASGELVAIMGPNGAGKTTLLQLLSGASRPTEGRVETHGAVGWVPQQTAVYGKLSVAENLRLFARLEGVEDSAAAVEAMLEQTGLRDRANDETQTLSGGNRQRVNIAVGLLADPPVVLLDEPSSSLDPRQRELLWEFISRLAQRGTTVVYTTHNVAEAERYADRVVVLADGELLFTGTPAELAAQGAGSDGFEAAFVAFLRERGH